MHEQPLDPRQAWLALAAEVNALMHRMTAVEAGVTSLRQLYSDLPPLVRDMRAARSRAETNLEEAEDVQRVASGTLARLRRQVRAPKRKPVPRKPR